MKAKLVKRSNDRFDLYSIEDKNQINTIASSFDNPIGKLSLKNCQAIELGYDLDELAIKNYPNNNFYGQTSIEQEERQKAFVKGCETMIELMSDKKFSEEDIRNAYLEGANQALDFNPDSVIDENKYIQSLQQTEWDVEIIEFTADDLKSINNEWHKLGEPKLDADGCLILKTFKS